jgi:hypothetical protein
MLNLDGEAPRKPSSPMHEVRTEIEIEATPERVGSILLDFPSHPEWNPFVRCIEGFAIVGDRLTVSIQPQGGRGMTFRPTVLAVIPNQELRWLGRSLLPGIAHRSDVGCFRIVLVQSSTLAAKRDVVTG